MQNTFGRKSYCKQNRWCVFQSFSIKYTRGSAATVIFELCSQIRATEVL